MARTKRTEKGFTLIELMVVLVIIGLTASVVVLAVPESGGSLSAEAEGFAARAKAARDGAILESRAAAVRVGPGGYSLSRRIGGRWQGVSSHEWADGTSAALTGANADGVIRFDATGIAQPASLVLSRGERRIAIEIGSDGNARVRR